MSDIWADAKYLGDWGAALTDLSKHLSELNGSSLVLQLDNPDDIEDLTVTVKTDYDADDGDWLASLKTQAHWLKAIGLDLNKCGFTWKMYDDNFDIFSKISSSESDPLEEEKARLQALISGFSSVRIQ